MGLVVISGSTRNKSTTIKIAQSVLQLAEQSQLFNRVDLLDFASIPLPIWDNAIKSEMADWQHEWQVSAQLMQSADAIMIVSPEWEETSLDNFYAFCERDNLALLPSAVLRVGSNCRGTYSSSELWLANFCKNRTCLILEHFIVATIESVNNCKESYYPFETPLVERILANLGLMKQLVDNGGLLSSTRLHLV
ncbi:MAG: NAD(P)H-dependent oxidoreductase [Moritella sp.]|uniref:NADPH-dependent FMN reductase n=1 Tax=Moritella sp. TaxID=78556 RepID=UPI0029BE6A40|nr:NAD(P)H-dependent oxidoreductase [Moritella sp.]MDX2320020.1 NAD(P)H-dependent oxidoreductase [Moritella sp.]